MRSTVQRNRFASLAIAGVLLIPLSLLAADKQTGKPFLGIAVEPQTAEGNQPGLVLRDVSPNGPAAKAGLKAQDRVVKVDNKDVKSFDDLLNALSNHKPGDKVEVKAVRDGKEQNFNVTLGEMSRQPRAVTQGNRKPMAFLGIQTQPLTSELKEQLGVKTDKGVVVTSVLPDSPASKAGLKDEDVITHVGSVAVNNPEDLRDAIQKTGPGKEAMLKLVRGKHEMELKATLQEAPAGGEFPGGNFPMPEEFGRFLGKQPMMFQDQEKIQTLEKRIQELEKRVRELEHNKSK